MATSVRDRGQVLEDRWLVDALADAGASARLAAWDDPHESWEADVVVIRSTWGYQHRVDAFHTWLDQVAEASTLLNPAPMVRANIDKLRQMAWLDALGVPRVPGRVLTDALPAPELAAVADAAFPGAPGFVLKPTMSASGHQTFLIDPARTTGCTATTLATAARAMDEIVRRPGRPALLLQPFQPEIDDGELALVYFGGGFSHAFLRFPAVFRERRSARFVPRPPAAALALAERILASFDAAPAYARVDMIEVDGEPVVMEVELAEPGLGLEYLPADHLQRALGLFVDAVLG